MADGAFWFHTASGAFVTSTFYRPDLPAWAAAFNEKKLADGYANRAWQFLDPSTGPGHAMPALGPSLYPAVFGSPFGNELLASFAMTALQAERLGQRGVTDMLTVSFSSNDAVGHAYGPDSPEVHDIAVRTDRVLGELLAKVDELVGLDHTMVILTADHGVAPVPEVQQARRLPGGRLKAEQLFGPIDAALTARYGAGKWILATAGTSPYLNYELIAQKKLDPVEVREVAALGAAAAPHVARVYTRDQLLRGDVPDDSIGRRLARSHSLERSGDLEIVLDPVLDARLGRHDSRHAVRLRRPHPPGVHGTGRPAGPLRRIGGAERPRADPRHDAGGRDACRVAGARAERDVDARRASARAGLGQRVGAGRRAVVRRGRTSRRTPCRACPRRVSR